VWQPLLTERHSIQPLSMLDVDAFLDYRQNPEIARFQSWEPSYSRADAENLIRSQSGVDFPLAGDWLQLGVHLLESGQLVGDLALHNTGTEHTFEIGFTFALEHQGKGYATEAAWRLIDYLFDEKLAEVIFATPDSRNLRSINLLKKLGFANQEAKSWSEQFKGETVRVEHFELVRK
jgi:RimJ/RimL family protein N-acetyltransferase